MNKLILEGGGGVNGMKVKGGRGCPQSMGEVCGITPAAIFYVVLFPRNKTRPLNSSVMEFHNLVGSIAGIFVTW